MAIQTLSVVMPVYNEKGTILKIISKVLALDEVKELIIVDDCSIDGTRELLKNYKFDERVRFFYHDRNQGKGAALRTGFQHASGEIVVVQDADLEYDPKELVELMKPIEDGLADVVYGSRLSGGKPQRVCMFWHRLGNDFLSFLTNFLFNTTLTDMETCYKMFRRDVIAAIKIRSNGFSVEPELTAKILKNRNLRVYEIPISYYGRSYSEGKKITWRHGISAVLTLLKYRFID
ncbi:MAG: glycosyltransferase family 2 protein [Candidatus Omnitrophota bacterium]|nr:glycosyltransferase family 2 protein [Candidatus Omnitrophota bacterium]